MWLPNKTDDTKDKKGNPVKQWGWGIFQDDEGSLDNPTNKNYVTTASVFNWRENVRRGVTKLENKLADHNRFMGYFKQTYEEDGKEEVVPPLMVDRKIGGMDMPTEMFGVLVLYNGANTNSIPRSMVWKGKYEPDGITPKPEAIYSPVTFNKDGIREWTYWDNRNKYAELIALEMQSTWVPKE